MSLHVARIAVGVATYGMGVVRVVVAEDHPLMLEAVAERVDRDPGLTVVGTATTAAGMVEAWREHRPDVLLADYGFADLNGIEALKLILEEDRDAKVVMLSAHDEPGLVSAAIRAGASGYLLKSVSGPELVAAIHAAADGEIALDHRTTALLVSEVRRPSRRPTTSGESILSPREVEVLRLVSDGLSNNEIAVRLYISVDTVKTHLERIFGKLHVKDRAAAVRQGMEKGVIP